MSCVAVEGLLLAPFQLILAHAKAGAAMPALILQRGIKPKISPKRVATALESAPRGETRMKLDLLAIAAHPDDAELTCGGTLAKMAKHGYKVGILDLTAGEMGTRGTPETRAKEAEKAAKILGVKCRGNLGVRGSDVQPGRAQRVRLAQVRRELRARLGIRLYWD